MSSLKLQNQYIFFLLLFCGVEVEQSRDDAGQPTGRVRLASSFDVLSKTFHEISKVCVSRTKFVTETRPKKE